VALSDDYDFQFERTGPKRFTEYSFSAIMVLVAQIGSFVCMTSQLAIMIPISWLIPLLYIGGDLFAVMVVALSLVAFAIGLIQVFLGYRLHTEGLGENNKIILFNIITIVVEISMYVILGISAGLLVLIIILQVSIAIILLNIASIYFLRTEEVQREFRRIGNVG